jgi:pimeloyl-ACP methyl ester carboxylesterase
MKKILLKLINIFLVSFTYLFFVQSAFAFQFEKIPENPLPVSYINNYTNQQQANIFKEGDLYKGIFVINKAPETYYSLGYFESIDGINWEMKKEILNTGADLSNPRILKTQTGYILFLTRYDNNTVYRIYSSNCDFNFNCSQSFSPIIIPDINSNSEKNGVFAGFPYQQDDRTYLIFGAWGGDGFKIKFAYSDDLVTWQSCPNDKSFLAGGDGPFVYKENNDLYLFFHRSDSSGIKLAKTILPLSCDSSFADQGYLLSPNKTYDQNHLIFSSIINNNDGLKLYYSGLGTDNRWRLNLACTGQACLSSTPTPTPTSTLTSTPTLTPTPIPITEKIPLVIIPGFMASWNKDAIIHNKTVSLFDWEIPSFVKEYQGLINSLIKLNYLENQDFFIFAYDWRKSVEETTNNLDTFLQQKIWSINPNQKIDFIGHSLGGLIGSIYTQKNKNKVNKIISIGSPHQGVIQVYKPLEAGEIDRENTFLWLAQKLILILNKSAIETDKETIQNRFPVAFDIFPIFNFLKDSTGNEILVNNLTIKNNFLQTYHQNFSDIFPMFTSIYGEKDNQTPAGFVIEPANVLNQLLGNYKDGQPKSAFFGKGDYTVLSNSANQDTDSEKLIFDHGEIIIKSESIKKILSLLNISYKDTQIVEGQKTVISPSLIFLIKSPATISVEFNDKTYQEEEGIIFIPDAQSGNYNLKIQGTDLGTYTVHIGQISENNDLWEKIDGEIIQSPPSSQTYNYSIDYNNQTALLIFPTPTITSTNTSTVTPIVTPSPTPTETPTPTLTPTVVLQSTNSSSSSNHSPNNQSSSLSQSPVYSSKYSAPEVLGMSSREELISPTPESKMINQKVEKQSTKNLSIWDFVLPPIIPAILGGIGWFFRKKLFKK